MSFDCAMVLPNWLSQIQYFFNDVTSEMDFNGELKHLSCKILQENYLLARFLQDLCKQYNLRKDLARFFFGI